MKKYPVPQVLTTRDLPLPKPADLFVAGTLVGWYKKVDELMDRLFDQTHKNQTAINEIQWWLDDAWDHYMQAIKYNYETVLQSILVELPQIIQLAENDRVIDWLNNTHNLIEKVLK